MTAINVLGVLLALGFPWLSGWLFLRAIAGATGYPSRHNALTLGLAFFVGQLLVVLGLWISDATLGQWSIWPPIALFFAAAVSAALLRRKGRQAPDARKADNAVFREESPDAADPSTASRILLVVLLGLCILHLSLAAIEIIHRPVFPWDGWLNWMYRAKAWFYADQWLSFDTPAMWLNGVRENAYAVAGNHYPPLLPLTAVWMALTTGGWTETLVNLPTLGAGIAIALALYGLSRELDMSSWASALAAYLFLSLPLVGTHLSLAGMADIWMAGYAGLGFALIFTGHQREEFRWIWLGILFLVASRLVKLEGSVWLMAGLLFAILVWRPRWTIAAIAVCLFGGFGLAAMGVANATLPVVGAVGIVDGRLQVPLIGSYALADWELLDDYRDNFLRGGSWHLLWSGLVLVLLLLLRFRQWNLAGKISAGLLSLAAAMLFIFQFTENGAWAEDWSAINRLPLHFTPFLALTLAVGLQQLTRVSLKARAPVSAGLVIITCATLSATFLNLTSEASRNETGTLRRIDATALTAVIGKVSEENGSLIYREFQDRIAVVTSGPVSIDARAATLVTVASAGGNREAFNFFWRNDQAPGDLHSVFIDTRGDFTVDLGDDADWKGTILEIGLTAFDDGESLSLQGITLRPNNAAAQRRKAVADWMTPNSWSQRSVNWIDAGAAATQVALPTLLAIGAGVAALLILLLQGEHSPRALTTGLSIVLLAWLVLDTRWLASRLHMSFVTVAAYPVVTAKALDFGGDERVYTSVERGCEVVNESQAVGGVTGRPSLVLVGSENPADLFQRLRARYHLLPLAGLDLAAPGAAAAPAEHALVMKSAFRQPGEASEIVNIWLAALGSDRWSLRYENETDALLSASPRQPVVDSR
jgi:uncharacterized membrane protein YiaA